MKYVIHGYTRDTDGNTHAFILPKVYDTHADAWIGLIEQQEIQIDDINEIFGSPEDVFSETFGRECNIFISGTIYQINLTIGEINDENE